MLTHALTLNKELTQEEADVLAQIAVRRLSNQMLEVAKALNLKVTIDLQPNLPLSTADVEPRVDIRRARILQDKGAYAMPEVKEVKRILNAIFGPHELAHVLFDAQQQLRAQ
jgi:hypothetical protein